MTPLCKESKNGIRRSGGSGRYGCCSAQQKNSGPSGLQFDQRQRKLNLRLTPFAEGTPSRVKNQSPRAGLSSSERERVEELEREDRVLQRANALLRGASARRVLLADVKCTGNFSAAVDSVAAAKARGIGIDQMHRSSVWCAVLMSRGRCQTANAPHDGSRSGKGAFDGLSKQKLYSSAA